MRLLQALLAAVIISCTYNSAALGSLHLRSNGIEVSLSDNVVILEDRTFVVNIDHTEAAVPVSTSFGEVGAAITKSRNSSIEVLVSISSINMSLYYSEVDRSLANDNSYKNRSSWPVVDSNYRSILNTACKYPVPKTYSTVVSDSMVSSGWGILNCSSPVNMYDDRYCPGGHGLPYRFANLACNCQFGGTLKMETSSSASTWQPGSISLDCPHMSGNQTADYMSCLQGNNFTENSYGECSKKVGVSMCTKVYPCGNNTCRDDGTITYIDLNAVFPNNVDEVACEFEYDDRNHLYEVTYQIVYLPPTSFPSNLTRSIHPSQRNSSKVIIWTSSQIVSSHGLMYFHRSGTNMIDDWLQISHQLNLESEVPEDGFLTNVTKTPQLCSAYENNNNIISTDTWYKLGYNGPETSPRKFASMVLPDVKDPMTLAEFAQTGFYGFNTSKLATSMLVYNLSDDCTELLRVPNEPYVYSLASLRNFSLNVQIPPSTSILKQFYHAASYDLEASTVILTNLDSSNNSSFNHTSAVNTSANSNIIANNSFVLVTLSLVLSGCDVDKGSGDKGFNFTNIMKPNKPDNSTNSSNCSTTNSTHINTCTTTNSSNTVTDKNPSNTTIASNTTNVSNTTIQFVTIGLYRGEDELVTMLDLVILGCSITVNFTVPIIQTNTSGNINNTLNGTSNATTVAPPYTVFIQSGGQNIYLAAYSSLNQPKILVNKPAPPFVLAKRTMGMVAAMLSGIGLILVSFILVMIYHFQLREIAHNVTAVTYEGTSRLTKVCLRVRDRFGTSRTIAANNFRPQQHMVLVLLLLVSGIISAFTFTTSGYLAIFLYLTQDARNTVSQMPAFYTNVTNTASNKSADVDLYRQSELVRQQNFTSEKIQNCLEQTNYLQSLIDAAEEDAHNKNQRMMDTCSMANLSRAFVAKMANDQAKAWHNWYVGVLVKAYSDLKEDWEVAKRAYDPFRIIVCLTSKIACNFEVTDPPKEPKVDGSASVADEQVSSSDTSPSKPKSTFPWSSTLAKFSNNQHFPSLYFPTLSLPEITLPFHMKWVGWTLTIFSITIALDIVSLVFKMLRIVDTVGTAIEGEWEVNESVIKYYNDARVQVNLTEEERKAEDNRLDAGASVVVKKLHFFLSGWVYYVWKNWMNALWKLEQAVMALIVVVLLGVVAFLIFSFLTPGILESMHLTSLIAQPVAYNIMGTNHDLVSNAVRLNEKQMIQAQIQQQTSLSQMQSQVDSFNNNEKIKITQWKALYVKMATEMSDSQNQTSKNNSTMWTLTLPNKQQVVICNLTFPLFDISYVNFTALMLQAANRSRTAQNGMFVFCPMQPCTANIYNMFDVSLFEEEMIARANEYLAALRVIFQMFFATLAIYIGFRVVANVSFEIFWAYMKRLGAVRLRQMIRFQPRDPTLDAHNSTEQGKVPKMSKDYVQEHPILPPQKFVIHTGLAHKYSPLSVRNKGNKGDSNAN